MPDRLLDFITSTPPDVQDRICEAMKAANPDIDGDLMRHLDARGVGDVVREAMEITRRPRRSRYVQGWRA